LIVCRECQSENEDGSRFCDSCGAGLAGLCPSCGAVTRAGARFCSQCRHPLQASAPPQPNGVVEPQAAAEVAPIDEGARKYITVLFADLRGATQLIAALDPEAAMQQLDPAIEAMCAAVVQAGGMVNRIEGDGVMALFGAPVAREDHAVRACLAARQMLASVARVDPTLAIRVGVASGEVVIRQIGRGPSDWDAVGVTPNLARRMEQLAQPGTVLITAGTAQLVRGYADLVSLGPVDVKGMAAPVEVFELRNATPRPTWEVRAAAHALNRFVGRETELGQLAAAASRAALGRGRVVSVIGDAGVGKSRLMHEFLRTLPGSGWHVLRAAAVSHAAHAAYYLAAEVLRAWIGVETTDERDQIGRKLTHALTLHGEGIEAVPLRALLDLPVADPEWPTLELPVRRARVQAAMRMAILREAAAHPLVLLVEDLHWADHASLALLEAIVDGLGAARLLVIVTTRPVAGGDGRPLRWVNRSYSSELHLHPLSPEDAESLLEDLLGRSPALAPLRRQIIERTEGTPLFLEEVARSINERALIEPAAPIEIPVSVQAVLAERTDRLPPDRKRVLQLAAVIGKDVPFALLRRISDLPEERLLAELAELQAAEFIYELHLSSGMEFTFKHAVTQAVVYEGMLRRHRRDLHARTLTAMEALFADRLEEMVERLAEHATKGEAWSTAVSYAQRAGRRACRHWSWAEAVGYFDQAIEALSHLPAGPQTTDKAIELRLDLRVALGPMGDIQRMGAALSQAHALAAGVGNDLRLAQVNTSRCIAHSLLGGLDEAVEAGQLALAAAARLDEPSSFLSAVFALGQAHWYRGEIAEAEAVLLRGLPHVRGALRVHRSGSTGTASVLHLVCLSKTYAMGGQAEAAVAIAQEALAIAEETRQPYDLAYARVAEGFHHYMLRDYGAGAAAFEIGLGVCRASGIALLISSIARYLGHCYAALGRRDEAHALLEEALAQSSTQGVVAFLTWGEAGSGHAHLPDRKNALPRFERAFTLAREHGYRAIEAHAAHMLGLHAPRESAAAQAHAAGRLRHALQLAQRLKLRPLEAWVQADLAELLRHDDEMPRASSSTAA
jgi:class 3 adenylate cyclase/tetratricopeptide (TPR) repeat protein